MAVKTDTDYRTNTTQQTSENLDKILEEALADMSLQDKTNQVASTSIKNAPGLASPNTTQQTQLEEELNNTREKALADMSLKDKTKQVTDTSINNTTAAALQRTTIEDCDEEDEDDFELLNEIAQIDTSKGQAVNLKEKGRAIQAEECMDELNRTMFSLYKISPNLSRVCRGVPNPNGALFVLGSMLFGYPFEGGGLSSQLYLVVNPKKLESVVSETMNKVQEIMPSLILANPLQAETTFNQHVCECATKKLNELEKENVIKKVDPSEAAKQCSEIFPVYQGLGDGQNNKKNQIILEHVGVHKGHEKYQIMLKDPFFKCEYDLLSFELFLKDSSYITHIFQAQKNVEKKILERFNLGEISSEEALAKYILVEMEKELRVVLGCEYGRYYLLRKELLIKQYVNRPLYQVAPQESLTPGWLGATDAELRYNNQLYYNDLPLLRVRLVSSQRVINGDQARRIDSTLKSESGYFLVKDMKAISKEMSENSGEGNLLGRVAAYNDPKMLFTPLSQAEYGKLIQETSSLDLESQPISDNCALLKELGVAETMPLYRTLSKDRNLHVELVLAEIGMYRKDQAIGKVILDEFAKEGSSGQEKATEMLSRLRTFQTSLNEKQYARYKTFLIEALSAQYQNRM